MISSDLPEAIGISDRVLVMRGGRIVHQLPSFSATEEEVMLHATGTFTSQSENAMDNNKPVTELPVKAPFDFAKWWDRVGILIVLLVLLILMSTFAPNFNRVDNLLNIARSISVNAILAAGMTFVILTSGIDLSVGSIVAVSGVVSVVAAMAGLPAPLAILAGVGVGALCGLLNGVLTAYLALAPFIVTLGTMTFLRGMAYTITEGQPIVSSSLSFRELGNGYLAGIPVPVIIMLIVYLLAWFILERTRFGRHIYAVGGNACAARPPAYGSNACWRRST